MFIQACILSGCDYVPNLPGKGIVGAFKSVCCENGRKADDRVRHCFVGNRGQLKARGRDDDDDDFDGKKEFDNSDGDFFKNVVKDVDQYVALSLKAEAVFFYHRVYDIDLDDVVSLLPGLDDGKVFGDDEEDVGEGAKLDGEDTVVEKSEKENNSTVKKSSSSSGNKTSTTASRKPDSADILPNPFIMFGDKRFEFIGSPWTREEVTALGNTKMFDPKAEKAAQKRLENMWHTKTSKPNVQPKNLLSQPKPKPAANNNNYNKPNYSSYDKNNQYKKYGESDANDPTVRNISNSAKAAFSSAFTFDDEEDDVKKVKTTTIPSLPTPKRFDRTKNKGSSEKTGGGTSSAIGGGGGGGDLKGFAFQRESNSLPIAPAVKKVTTSGTLRNVPNTENVLKQTQQPKFNPNDIQNIINQGIAEQKEEMRPSQDPCYDDEEEINGGSQSQDDSMDGMIDSQQSQDYLPQGSKFFQAKKNNKQPQQAKLSVNTAVAIAVEKKSKLETTKTPTSTSKSFAPLISQLGGVSIVFPKVRFLPSLYMTLMKIQLLR